MDNFSQKEIIQELKRRVQKKKEKRLNAEAPLRRLAIESAPDKRTLPPRAARTARAALSMALGNGEALSGGEEESGPGVELDEQADMEIERQEDPDYNMDEDQSGVRQSDEGEDQLVASTSGKKPRDKDDQRSRDVWMVKARQQLGSAVPIYREEISLYTIHKDPDAQLVNFPNLPIETWEANYQVDLNNNNLVPREPSGAYILPRVDESEDWTVRGRLFNSAFGKTPNSSKDRQKFNMFVNKIVDSLLIYTGKKPSREFLCGFTSQIVNLYQGLWDGSPNGNAGLTHHLIRRFKYLSKTD